MSDIPFFILINGDNFHFSNHPLWLRDVAPSEGIGISPNSVGWQLDILDFVCFGFNIAFKHLRSYHDGACL